MDENKKKYTEKEAKQLATIEILGTREYGWGDSKRIDIQDILDLIMFYNYYELGNLNTYDLALEIIRETYGDIDNNKSEHKEYFEEINKSITNWNKLK